MAGKMFYGHVSGVMAMVALALGYIVCTLAGKEKSILRKLGYVIGISVITISSVLIVCNILCTLGLYPKSHCMLKTGMPIAVPQK